MKSRDTVPLVWRKPPEWERFIEAVARNNRGYTSPYAGIAIEQAWDEYREQDRLEVLADRLLGAGGASRAADRKKTHLPSTRDAHDETGRTTVRVLREVRDEMAAEATKMGVEQYELLRAVVSWYLDGGREGRVRDKLERGVPDALDALDAMAGTGDLSPAEEDAVAVCHRLGPEFSDADLRDAIMAVADGDTERHYYQTRAPEVIERKGVRRFERDAKPDLYLQPDTWDAKMVTAIEGDLGADRTEGKPPDPFTRDQFASAATDASLEVSTSNRAEVNRIKDQLLERYGYAYDEDRELFVPQERDPTAAASVSGGRPDA